MFKNRHTVMSIAAASACALLSGCGGGGNGSVDSAMLRVSVSNVVGASAGQTVVLNGYAVTAGQPIASAVWTQTNGPAVQLQNADCQTSKLSESSSSSSPNAAKAVSYTCSLTVNLPNAAQPADYGFRFSVDDSYGNRQSATTSVAAKATQAAPLIVTAGPSVHLYPGDTYKGVCSAVGGTYNGNQAPAYDWSISGPPGVNIPPLQTDGQSVTLKAPLLSSQATLTLTCQARDGVGAVATSTVPIVVHGTDSLPALVVDISPAQIVNTVQAVVISAAARAAGGSPRAPVYYYWRQVGGKNDVAIANKIGAQMSFVSPGTPGSNSPTAQSTIYDTLTFRVYVSYQPIDESNYASVPVSQTADTVVVVMQKTEPSSL